MKIKDMTYLMTPARKEVFSALNGRVFFVGGAVRDLLQRRSIQDVDMTTSYSPEEVISLLEKRVYKIIPSGLKYGTLTLVLKDKTLVELTSFRTDQKTDGRHAVVAFNSGINQDALRRDFTINALYLNEQGEVLDFVKGLSDLQKNRLRFIGNPDERIKEDALRILRYFRFYAYTNQTKPDKLSFMACKNNRLLLDKVSWERQKNELFKILDLESPFKAIRLMLQAGVLKKVLGVRVFLTSFKKLLKTERKTGRKTTALFRLWVLTHGQKIGFPLTRLENQQWASWNRSFNMPFQTRKDQLTILYREGVESFINIMEYRMKRPTFSGLQFYMRLKVPQCPFSSLDVADFFKVTGPALGEKIKQCELVWLRKGCPDKKELVFLDVF